MLGAPITFNYNGQQTFKTPFGGALTIVSLILTLIIVANRAKLGDDHVLINEIESHRHLQPAGTPPSPGATFLEPESETT